MISTHYNVACALQHGLVKAQSSKSNWLLIYQRGSNISADFFPDLASSLWSQICNYCSWHLILKLLASKPLTLLSSTCYMGAVPKVVIMTCSRTHNESKHFCYCSEEGCLYVVLACPTDSFASIFSEFLKFSFHICGPNNFHCCSSLMHNLMGNSAFYWPHFCWIKQNRY